MSSLLSPRVQQFQGLAVSNNHTGVCLMEYLFQRVMLCSRGLMSGHRLPVSSLTGARGGTSTARGESRHNVLGRRVVCTWTGEPGGRVPQAHGARWGTPCARSSPLLSGGLAPRGALETC